MGERAGRAALPGQPPHVVEVAVGDTVPVGAAEVVVVPPAPLLVLEGGGLVPLRFVVSSEAGRVVVDVPDGLFERVVELAREHDILVVHDNAYSETTYDGYVAPSFLATPGAAEVGVASQDLDVFSDGNTGLVATNRFLVFLPEFPSLAAGPGRVMYAAWADGRNGDGSPVDGMSVNYTGYDINAPGKPLVEWDRPSRKQDRDGAYAPRAARCKTLSATQQAAFDREIARRERADEKYTLLPSWTYLLTGGWAGTPARNCTTFALQVWDATMADAPAERIDPTLPLPAGDLNRRGAQVAKDLTQSEYSAWIPALAGKWIHEKNGNRDENDEVPRFADDHLAPAAGPAGARSRN